MNAHETAKEVVQLARNAGLKNEVIELLELKLSLLTEHITTLQGEKARVQSENEKLKIQLKCLEPKDEEPSHDTIGILKLFFDHAKDISVTDITTAVKWKQSVVDYHLDVLLKKRFIRESTLGLKTPFGSSESMFGLTTLGRRYVIQYLGS